MRLKLTRTGGFAGIRPPPVEVDTAKLPPRLARRVEALVAGANFFELPDTLSAPKRQPDRFRYSLQIAHEDGREHAVTCDEEAAGGELRDLLDAVQSLKQA
jgi:hypothetical protein